MAFDDPTNITYDADTQALQKATRDAERELVNLTASFLKLKASGTASAESLDEAQKKIDSAKTTAGNLRTQLDEAAKSTGRQRLPTPVAPRSLVILDQEPE